MKSSIISLVLIIGTFASSASANQRIQKVNELDSFKSQFNASSDKVRVIALLSPT